MRSLLWTSLTLVLATLVACGGATEKKKSDKPAAQAPGPQAPGPQAPSPAQNPQGPQGPQGPAPAPAPGPSGGGDDLVIGALGDSITAGLNSVSFLQESKGVSWSTGDEVAATTGSHLARFKKELGVKTVKAVNRALSGGTSEDLADQVDELLGERPRYVTLLIGANDVCAWGETYAADLAAFKAAVGTALDRLIELDSKPKIVVSPVPSLNRLYDLMKDKSSCRAIWNLAGGCSLLLGKDATDADRTAFRGRWQALNGALEELATARAANGVRWAKGIADHQFTVDDVSAHDCFHPSAKGQKAISDLTWDQAFAKGALAP